MLGLRFCARAFSSCGGWGPLFMVVRGPLTVVASLVAEHRLQTHRLSSCGSRAQSLCGMWGLPRPGLEPMSPALAGRFSTTAPPGKPSHPLFSHQWPHLWDALLKAPCMVPSLLVHWSTQDLGGEEWLVSGGVDHVLSCRGYCPLLLPPVSAE